MHRHLIEWRRNCLARYHRGHQKQLDILQPQDHPNRVIKQPVGYIDVIDQQYVQVVCVVCVCKKYKNMD